MGYQTIATIVFCCFGVFVLLVLSFFRKSKTIPRVIGILSVIFGAVYLAYRAAFTLPNTWSAGLVFGIILFIAELLGFLQSLVFKTLYATRKKARPHIDTTWTEPPSLDVIISTYNESLVILSRTIIAATKIDYPKEKLHIYVGDDGRREEVKKFCSQIGVNYVTRPNNSFAKAGNINNVLTIAKSEFFLLLDADMIAKSTIVKEMMPYFRDSKTGFVQSPQVFYNHDVYQHNLRINDFIPNEQDFFMRDMMEKRAVYNAVLHIGSNAIFRRSAIDDIGGIPTKSITEDMATGMLLQAKGYQSFYVNKPLALGRSVETIRDLVKQRDRWLRGSLQVAKKYNPLTIKGLNLAQRIIYFDGVMYWSFGLQKMIYLLAPLLYLLAGLTLFRPVDIGIVLIFLPYFLSSILYFRRITHNRRNMTWSYIYDITLAPQMAWSFIKSIFTGKGLKFSVTPKDVSKERTKFDFAVAWPNLLLLLFALAGVGMGITKIVWQVGTDAIYATAINLIWCLYNSVGLFISIFVFLDRKELRKNVRMPSNLQTTGLIEDCASMTSACSYCGIISDLSDEGAELITKKKCRIPPLSPSEILRFNIQGIGEVTARVARIEPKKTGLAVGFQFIGISYETMNAINQYRFSWHNKYMKKRRINRKYSSFFEIIRGIFKKDKKKTF